MDRMDERRALAKALDEREERRKNVNSIPEVIEAREKKDAAHLAYDKAHNAFNRIFSAHYGRGDGDLIKANPDVVVLGLDMERSLQWIARCAVTKLPIFYGDKVYTIGNDDGYRVYILAEAVQMAPGFEGRATFITEDADEDDEDDAA